MEKYKEKLKNIIIELKNQNNFNYDKSDFERNNSYIELCKKYIDESKAPSNDPEFISFITGPGIGSVNQAISGLGETNETYCEKLCETWSNFAKRIKSISLEENEDFIKQLAKKYADACKETPTKKVNLFTNRILATYFNNYLLSIINYQDLKDIIDYISDKKFFKENHGTKSKAEYWFPYNFLLSQLVHHVVMQDKIFEITDNKINNIPIESFVSMMGWQIVLYVRRKRLESFVSLIKQQKNLILSGAPGTGKTYLAKEIAKCMVGENMDFAEMKKTGRAGFVQFHPSYDYSDFVEGLRPKSRSNNSDIVFERKDGVFKEFCKKAIKNAPNHCVFIIDEINRGDMSKIFGELFYSIDPGYRGKDGIVDTQYQNLIDKESDDTDDLFKEGFYVPENVFIIGTMNDIDRSVESMDFAMRRRFAFKEVTAKERECMLDEDADINDEECETAKNKMHALNNAIDLIPELGIAYNVGPAYFKKITLYSGNVPNKFKKLWENHIKGLLNEYLRGMPDAKDNMQKLKKAYFGTKDKSKISDHNQESNEA